MQTRFTAVLLTVAAVCVSPTVPSAQQRAVERFGLTWTRQGGWPGFYCQLEVSGSTQGVGGARLHCHAGSNPRATSRPDDVDAGIAALPASDIRRLTDLVARADLLGGRHVGRDARGGDGMFETLKVWINSPALTAVLVTSYNASFTGADETRTRLLQELSCLEERLRLQAGSAPNPNRKDCLKPQKTVMRERITAFHLAL
jgi:hypothetical protein